MDDRSALADRIGRYDWFHTIDFGNGLVTDGHCTAEILKAKADGYFSLSPKGKSVLDIGCWDGYFSLEALRRGAARVLATDHYVWHSQWDRGSFDLVREHLAPELEVKDIDVYDISPASVGTFDFVLFTGVFYHTRHPLLALERAASVCTDHSSRGDGPRRARRQKPGDGVLPRHRAEAGSVELVGAEPPLRRGHAARPGLQGHRL